MLSCAKLRGLWKAAKANTPDIRDFSPTADRLAVSKNAGGVGVNVSDTVISLIF
jgi:hypothetical protein